MPVGSFPRKVSTEQQLYASALRALTRRAHSIQEMREYLERRAQTKAHVTAVIERLYEQNYLDDARYALDYACSRANGRRQGRFRITRELRARGVSGALIDAALETVFAETDETTLVRARLVRLLAGLRGAVDRKKARSLYHSLLRAGFPSDLIQSELRNATRIDVSDSERE